MTLRDDFSSARFMRTPTPRMAGVSCHGGELRNLIFQNAQRSHSGLEPILQTPDMGGAETGVGGPTPTLSGPKSVQAGTTNLRLCVMSGGTESSDGLSTTCHTRADTTNSLLEVSLQLELTIRSALSPRIPWSKLGRTSP